MRTSRPQVIFSRSFLSRHARRTKRKKLKEGLLVVEVCSYNALFFIRMFVILQGSLEVNPSDLIGSFMVGI